MAQQGLPIIQGQDPLGGLRLGLQGFVDARLRAMQGQQASQQLGQLFPNLNLQGITDPRALQLAGQLGLQQAVPQPGFQLSPGQTRFTAAGQPVAQVPAAPIAPVSGTFQQITDPVTGKQINALISPRTGNIIKKFGTVEEGLSAKDKIQVAVTQSKEFRADPRIKNLNIIERSERGMTAALKMATAPDVKSRIASDQALGVLFQKMLDPESVVRESEFARTPEGAAAINRILAIAPQLRLGGLRLLDEDREALVSMARKLLTEAKISFNKTFDEFEAIADETGLNKRVVFGSAKKFDIGGISTTPTGGQITTPKTQADFDAIPLGTTFIDTDGKRKVKQ